MIRTTGLAALALALMGAAATAQTLNAPESGAAGAPPAQLSGPASEAPPPAPSVQQAQDQHARDLYCRRDAAARTGYVTPGQAANHAQTSGTVGGTLGGAALGAIIGGASGHAGAGAAIGAGAGMIAGTAMGADNARAAAGDVERNYAEAYYACMGQGPDQGPGEATYAYGPPPAAYPPPPPAPYYGPYPYPYPYPYYYGRPYYGPAYYGPSVTFGFGFGGWHHGGFHRHWR